jgi:hypothetical protein
MDVAEPGSLPEGFRFDAWNEDLYLRIGTVTLAILCPVRSGPDAPWRICLRPDRLGMRYRFTNTKAGAVWYVTRWAQKWESELRELKTFPLYNAKG